MVHKPCGAGATVWRCALVRVSRAGGPQRSMDARTNIKARLPSRHVTEGPARAPHRSYDSAMSLTTEQIHQPFVGVASCWNEAVFKKTPYIADLKPGGRYVAKDIFEVGGIPLLMKTLLDHGFLHGDCITVTGRTIAENLKSVKSNPNQDVVRPANDPITVTGGVVGAITHPGGKAEKISYADA
jgi:dihydroxyacid dehydratase/phosphogluconate dehydratase